MKKVLSLVLLLCLLCTMTACVFDNENLDTTTASDGGDGTPIGDSTSTGETSAATTVTTTNNWPKPTGTPAPNCENTVPTPVAAKTVRLKFAHLGISVSEVNLSEENQTIATATVNSSRYELALTAQSEGAFTFQVANAFGHTATISVSVDSNLLLTAEVTAKPDVIDAGAYRHNGTKTRTDMEMIQATINAAYNKYLATEIPQTAYVCPGRYTIDGYLQMMEGVTLKLYTEMTDAKAGYTADIKQAVDAERFAIFHMTGRILNVPYNTFAKDCATRNYYCIDGGVLDMDGVVLAPVIVGFATGVTIQNVIFKDLAGNHAIQITGCTDTQVKNCMFAGYKMGNSFTREVIQVEPTAPGACGSNVDTTPIKFSDTSGAIDYYKRSKNITISDCYFGKSDTLGGPLMAIGHHSYKGAAGANVVGMYIKNNVFDECFYAAIRFTSISKLEITGNTFIASPISNWSTADIADMSSIPTKGKPALIQFYHYSNIRDIGIQISVIRDNTFILNGAVDRRIIYYESATLYNEKLTVQNNDITFSGDVVDYTDYYICLGDVKTVDYTEGKVLLGDNTFTDGVLRTIPSSS